jgi:hypothetical protein
MQIEDGFWRHFASYRIDGFPPDDINRLTRSKIPPRITVPNAACGFGVRGSTVAVKRAALGRVHPLVG